jgi:hypothetical protein
MAVSMAFTYSLMLIVNNKRSRIYQENELLTQENVKKLHHRLVNWKRNTTDKAVCAKMPPQAV